MKGNEVVGLYVSANVRNAGIGSKLLAHIESYARANKIEELQLSSTISAFEFYKAKGDKVLNPVIVSIRGIEFKETKMLKDIS